MKKVQKKIKKRVVELVTKTEFANRCGIRLPSLSRLISRGKVKTTKYKDKELINWKTQGEVYNRIRKDKEVEKQEKEDNTIYLTGIKKGNPTGKIKNIADARFQLEKYKAKKAKEEYDLFTGSLVKVEDVKKAWIEVASALKKSIMTLPARIGPILAGESDPHSAKMLLKRELTQCLQDTVDNYKPKEGKKKVVKKKVIKKLIRKKR